MNIAGMLMSTAVHFELQTSAIPHPQDVSTAGDSLLLVVTSLFCRIEQYYLLTFHFVHFKMNQ